MIIAIKIYFKGWSYSMGHLDSLWMWKIKLADNLAGKLADSRTGKAGVVALCKSPLFAQSVLLINFFGGHLPRSLLDYHYVRKSIGKWGEGQ